MWSRRAPPGSDVMADVALAAWEAWATVSQAGYGGGWPPGVGGGPNLPNNPPPWSLTANNHQPNLKSSAQNHCNHCFGPRRTSSSPALQLADYCWSDLWQVWLLRQDRNKLTSSELLPKLTFSVNSQWQHRSIHWLWIATLCILSLLTLLVEHWDKVYLQKQ